MQLFGTSLMIWKANWLFFSHIVIKKEFKHPTWKIWLAVVMGKQFYYKWIFQKMPVIDAKQNPICTFKLLCVQNHSQATLCTAHAWINQDCKESIVIISDNPNHTKNTVYTFMSFLYNHLPTKYPTIEAINTFSDGATSQFKQRYLFSNLYTWEQNSFKQISFWIFLQCCMERGLLMV